MSSELTNNDDGAEQPLGKADVTTDDSEPKAEGRVINIGGSPKVADEIALAKLAEEPIKVVEVPDAAVVISEADNEDEAKAFEDVEPGSAEELELKNKGYWAKAVMRPDFLTSDIYFHAPTNGRHRCEVLFQTVADRQLMFTFVFDGHDGRMDVAAEGRYMIVTIDDVQFEGECIQHPEWTLNAATRGLGSNQVVVAADRGAFPDEDRTRMLGSSLKAMVEPEGRTFDHLDVKE